MPATANELARSNKDSTTGAITGATKNVTNDAVDGAAHAAQASSAGALLRQARQQRGLDIEALAAMLKVPQAKLEALEADRLKDLPDITFARALAKAMCRVLKLDAEPVLALLPRGSEPVLNVSRGLNQAYRDRGGPDDSLSLATLLRPVVWGPILLLLGAALVYNLPTNWLAGRPGFTAPSSPSANTGSGTVTVQPLAQQLPSDEPPAAAVAGPIVEPSPNLAAAAVPTVAATLPTPVSVPVPVPLPQPPPPDIGQVSSSAATAAGGGLVALTVKAKAESWVEIVDARGQSLLSRPLRAGDATEMTGQPPFKVIVGNVNGTELTLRGRPVDLVAQAKDNVARFELK